MKIKSVKIENIAIIENMEIAIDKPLLLFYGEIKQGKTTILNCIRWAFGGSFPKDIITHGQSEAFIEIVLENGLINRSFYVNKDSETVARNLKIVLNNRPAKVNDLKRFLNPFLLDQNHLINMKPPERAKFILELFQVDTTELDSELIQSENKAQLLRAKIKGYGDNIPVDVQKPDMEALIANKKAIEDGQKEQKEMIEAENKIIKANHQKEIDKILEEITAFNTEQDERKSRIASANETLKNIQLTVKSSIFEKCFDFDGAKKIIELLPQPENKKSLVHSLPEPKLCDFDTTDLINAEKAIQEAEIQQVKYEAYLKDFARYEEKLNCNGELKTLEGNIKRARLVKAQQQETINGIIEGLEYKDFQIWYENTTFEMLSTSQVMQLSSKLSALYPESLGLELIDKGESLGKSVMLLVDKAQKEEKNILVTIVGERPTLIPENIGVFYVENGGIK